MLWGLEKYFLLLSLKGSSTNSTNQTFFKLSALIYMCGILKICYTWQLFDKSVLFQSITALLINPVSLNISISMYADDIHLYIVLHLLITKVGWQAPLFNIRYQGVNDRIVYDLTKTELISQ